MENKYLVNSADLTAVADAIRTKGGTSGALTFPSGFADAIAAIQAGGGEGGGNAKIYTGTITFEEDTSVPVSGLNIPLALPSRVKIIYMWMDREDFFAVEVPVNNKMYSFTVLPLATSTIPPVRASADTAVQDTGDRMWLVQTNVNACAESQNGYGITGSVGSIVNRNHEYWSCNDDGSITISRIGSAGLWFYAGSYHYIAVC